MRNLHLAPVSTLSDHDLISLVRQGSEAAFKEVYLRYDSLLYIYAYKKLQNKAEAQDVVQEVFITLWNSRETFILKSTLSGFLYKSVLNKVFNIFKHQHIIQQYISSGEHFIETDSAETDYLVREKDIAALIEKEIAAMPPRMREIYELKRKEFLSTKEIAARLQISEMTVSTQMKRALKLLKLKLGVVIYIVYVLHG
ncbi:RNA polymerase sigma factor [Mucilaginibacter paludis]|uniref:RNA polymerase, sigma-24 subunit, ECF subfamily n=1 Tax=Mucilaginibacter paludis DSM 18603 TaxID=714943 RepID=H1YC90_9SPHI|nr:RNA polymerase sigma-70 factor [Mucilaginibacter paludis]EHQ30081.1 RNA polymerase, sigma-24 subunit, ECF subfamily [Mucilaginibacter paludis DSM 18603]